MSNATPILRVGEERIMVQGKRHCLVASWSNPGSWHSVEIDNQNQPQCTCTGYTIRKSCRHAKAVRDWMLGHVSAHVEPPEAA